MKYFPLLILVVMLFSLLSCEKEEESETYFWNETGCADPWAGDSDGSEEGRKRAIEEYLTGQDVSVEGVNLAYNVSLAEACLACNCQSGWIFAIQVAEDDGSKMEALNFYQ